MKVVVFLLSLFIFSNPISPHTIKRNYQQSSLDFSTVEWVEDMTDMIPEGTTSFPKDSSLSILTVYGERKIINLTDLKVNDYRVSSGNINHFSKTAHNINLQKSNF